MHLHTTYSDGILSPLNIVKFTRLTNHDVISVTDHDTMEGLEEVEHWAERFEIEMIPGVEISTYHAGREYHVLGYYLDWKDAELASLFNEMHLQRENRIRLILSKLVENYGIRIEFSDLRNFFKTNNYGRPHIALLLMKNGIVGSVREAFDKYLGDDGPCSAEKLQFATSEAVELIRRKGGLSVLAHPGIYFAHTDTEFKDILALGFDGIEVFHPMNDAGMTAALSEYAETRHLIVTGGSDYHGYLNEDIFSVNIDLKDRDLALMRSRSSRDPASR